MSQIKDTRFIADNAIRDEDILLDNNNFLRGRNAANSANINILKVDASDRVHLGDTAGSLPIVFGNQLASNPTGVTAGVYYNTVSNEFRFYNGTTWAALGGGSGANTTLSNLTSPTSVNQNLLPATPGLQTLGSASAQWGNSYFNDLFCSSIVPRTGDGTGTIGSTGNRWLSIRASSSIGLSTGGVDKILMNPAATLPSGGTCAALFHFRPSEDIGVFTGSSTATGTAHVQSGNASAGNSGDVNLQTGTATGTRGRVIANARTFRLPKSASAPTATESGEMYYDTTTNKSYTWDGSVWQAHF